MAPRSSQVSRRKGFTLLFAVLISSVLLAIGMGIFNIVYRELQLSGLTRDSDTAIFAADAGIECGLYWEFKGMTAVEPVMFDPTDAQDQTINCGGSDLNAEVIFDSGNVAEWEFTLPVGATGNDSSCADVIIRKDWNDFSTSIESNGRNEGGANCVVGDRTVERTLQVDF